MTNNEKKGSYYIIADHLRTTIFALADGAVIESKGRGYILRKLVKRSCLLIHFLNINHEKLLQVVKKLIEINSFFYIHLKKKEKLINEKLKDEIEKEINFIANATKKIDKYCLKNLQKLISAKDIFLWYDTYGIPLELIRYQLNKKERDFSEKEFNQLLEKQKLLGKRDREGKKINVFL